MVRNWKVWGVLGLLLALVVVVGYGQQPIWFLVHGLDGSAADWTKSVLGQMRAQRPDLFGPIYIADLERQNNAHLFDWAVNLVNEMERHGLLQDRVADKSVRVLAHSFGGAVTLYILRVAYELEWGNVNDLKARIKQACQAFRPGFNRSACDGIGDGVTRVPDTVKWVKAAKKIGEAYLYHPALLDGCGACEGSWAPKVRIPGTETRIGGGPTTACLCALGEVGRILWDLSRVTWGGQKKIVNIYGFGCDGVSCRNFFGFCSGHHDRWLQDDHQRLLTHRDGDRSRLQSGSYIEIFGGCHCHGDFEDNTNGAAAALVKIISDLNPRQPQKVTLSVGAWLPGGMVTIPIQVPIQIDGGVAVTRFTKSFDKGATVTMVAPADVSTSYGGSSFYRWYCGHAVQSRAQLNPNISFVINQDVSCDAAYEKMPLPCATLRTDKGEYDRGEKIRIFFTNGCNDPIPMSPQDASILQLVSNIWIEDEEGNKPFYANVLGPPQPPHTSRFWEWDQRNVFSGMQVPPGTYTVRFRTGNQWPGAGTYMATFKIK